MSLKTGQGHAERQQEEPRKAKLVGSVQTDGVGNSCLVCSSPCYTARDCFEDGPCGLLEYQAAMGSHDLTEQFTVIGGVFQNTDRTGHMLPSQPNNAAS